MKAIKWLYALVFSIAFTLGIEWVGAAAISKNMDWLMTLALPTFMPKPIIHSIIWCFIYLLSIFIISKIIIIEYFSPFVFIYIIVVALSALWLVIFFISHYIVFALFIMIAIVALCFLFEMLLLKYHFRLGLYYIPILFWNSFLFILNYCIVLMN